jgi:superfamily I DNA/RNA helicase
MTLEPTEEQLAIARASIDGFSAVICGAGVGKTHTAILSAKEHLARWEDDGDTKSKIMLLTHSSAAADELTLSAVDLGLDTTRVEILTMHAKAYEIVARFGSMLGIETILEILTERRAKALYEYLTECAQFYHPAVTCTPRSASDAKTKGLDYREEQAWPAFFVHHLRLRFGLRGVNVAECMDLLDALKEAKFPDYQNEFSKMLRQVERPKVAQLYHQLLLRSSVADSAMVIHLCVEMLKREPDLLSRMGITSAYVDSNLPGLALRN